MAAVWQLSRCGMCRAGVADGLGGDATPGPGVMAGGRAAVESRVRESFHDYVGITPRRFLAAAKRNGCDRPSTPAVLEARPPWGAG